MRPAQYLANDGTYSPGQSNLAHNGLGYCNCVHSLRSHNGLFALVCFDRCRYAIKQTREADEIDFRSIFPHILRQNVLAEIQRRVGIIVWIKLLSTEAKILNLIGETILND